MFLKDVKEPGFYIDKGNNKLLYEVLENKDVTWLEDDPDAKLVFDTWEFVYIEDDGRLRYECFDGILQNILYANDDVEVIKSEHEYKMWGSSGTVLTDETPDK